jgi:DNA-binding NtrC family response regulator
VKPVILLVDDEQDLVAVLAEAAGLALPAFEIVETTSIDEAEAILADLEATDTPLSLVVVDHALGGRTGMEFIEALQERYPSVPSILFTGRAPADIEERAKKLGARVLWKPIRLKAWIGEVRALLPKLPEHA